MPQNMSLPLSLSLLSLSLSLSIYIFALPLLCFSPFLYYALKQSHEGVSVFLGSLSYFLCFVHFRSTSGLVNNVLDAHRYARVTVRM